MNFISNRWSGRLIVIVLGAAVVQASIAGNDVGAQAGKGKAQPGINYRAKQQTPIKMGTSGGARNDLANGYCCGGTLGALVTDGQTQYLLSNYHVFAGDQATGGNGGVSTIGDPVIQPGLIDVGCNAASAQVVGTLTAYTDPFLGANVDAAIAAVVQGMVDPSGAILGIGTLSAATAPSSAGQRVKKSGRTTGLTASQVQAVNATVSVAYDTECAGTARGTKTFTGQIIIANRGSKFLAAGDSGSLLVEDKATAPRAVGLLYAGSSSVAIANPIDDVLTSLSVAMVGVGGAAASAPASDAAFDRAAKAQAKHARLLEQAPRGVGHAIGLAKSGRIGLFVLVESDAAGAAASLPAEVDGVPVEVVEVGRIVAF
jgi:hypothetical protein